MMPNQTPQQEPTVFPSLAGAPAPHGVPGVLTRSGQRKTIILVRSDALAPQLQRYLQAGIRHLEVVLFAEGVTVRSLVAIVRRGRRLPPYLHPLGQGGRFLADLYNKHRATSGRQRSPVPILILSVVPLIERMETSVKSGGV